MGFFQLARRAPVRELRRSAFARRIQVDFGPSLGNVYIQSLEDLIIYKIWYFSRSQLTKHLRDITAIVHSLGDRLDLQYIDAWVERKGLKATWQELLGKIQTD